MGSQQHHQKQTFLHLNSNIKLTTKSYLSFKCTLVSTYFLKTLLQCSSVISGTFYRDTITGLQHIFKRPFIVAILMILGYRLQQHHLDTSFQSKLCICCNYTTQMHFSSSSNSSYQLIFFHRNISVIFLLRYFGH